MAVAEGNTPCPGVALWHPSADFIFNSQTQGKSPLVHLVYDVGVSHIAQLSVLKRPFVSPHEKASSLLERMQIPQECIT